NPNYSLFKYTNDKLYELNINPMSGFVEPNHLEYFRFVGRIMGLALIHNQYLSVNFSFIVYKKLLNKNLCITDLIFVDPELYKNLNWLKNNDGADLLFLTFGINEKDSFDNPKYVELKPNGSNIAVTDSNKDEYIDLVIKYKLNNGNDKEQFKALKEGFYEIVPKKINKILNEFDLKFLLIGTNEIDIEDWKNNTEYEGYNENDITIINFWKCVNSFNQEDRIKLLIFATGNSQIPTTGFKDLQGNGNIQHFKLNKYGKTNELPKSHTCFNCIDLPPYKSYDQLKEKLSIAISEGIDEFSYA
ncbi:HECT-domain-containing protein, partial [Anaeromyces robustus]